MFKLRKILKASAVSILALVITTSALADSKKEQVKDFTTKLENVKDKLAYAQDLVDGDKDLLTKDTMLVYAAAMNEGFAFVYAVAMSDIDEDDKIDLIVGKMKENGDIIKGQGGALVQMGVTFSYDFLHHGREEVDDDQKLDWIYKLKASSTENLGDFISILSFPKDRNQKRSWGPLQEKRRETLANEMITSFNDFFVQKVKSMDQTDEYSVGSKVKLIVNQMIDKNLKTKRYGADVQRWGRNLYFGLGAFFAIYPSLHPLTMGYNLVIGPSYWSTSAWGAIYLGVGVSLGIIKHMTNSDKAVARLEELKKLISDPKEAQREIKTTQKSFLSKTVSCAINLVVAKKPKL